MPSWEEPAPYTERQAPSRRVSGVNVLLALHGAAFLLFPFVPGAAELLEFHASRALSAPWTFLTWTFVPFIDPGFLFAAAVAGYALFRVGNDLEAEWGARRTVLSYFGFALMGAIVHGAAQQAGLASATARTLLGPCTALALAAALRHPARPVLFCFLLPTRALTATILMTALAAAYAIVPAHQAKGVSPWALGGAVLAAAAIVPLVPRLSLLLERRAAARERGRFVEEVDLRRRVDLLLDKISREGMKSLSRAERRVLRRGSEIMRRGASVRGE